MSNQEMNLMNDNMHNYIYYLNTNPNYDIKLNEDFLTMTSRNNSNANSETFYGFILASAVMMGFIIWANPR